VMFLFFFFLFHGLVEDWDLGCFSWRSVSLLWYATSSVCLCLRNTSIFVRVS
jgi:hypothetical protein